MLESGFNESKSLHHIRTKEIEEGKAIRKNTPRASHAEWKPNPHRPDPVEILLSTSNNRLDHLLPLRYGRMSRSPFAYMRGMAKMMGYDLSTVPNTNIRVQLCGDCHLGNFGAFASPERRVLFDITDFDETIPGPWEYDLKRLTVSFILLARQHGYDHITVKNVALEMLSSYRKRMREFSMMSPLDVWYYIIDSEILIKTAPDRETRERRIEFEKKARSRTAEKLLRKMMIEKEGALQFINQKPVLERLERGGDLESKFRVALEKYPETLPEDRRYLLSNYKLSDIAFKVVGVGSVGTRCAVALYVSDGGDHLVLQVKEASPSVLESYVGKCPYDHQGQRVVVGQKLMQCASDIFLGWSNDNDGHHYYVRQLRDMKTNLSMEFLQGQVLHNFAEMCGWALARAHAKSGEAPRIRGYIGKSDQFEMAVSDFALAYADQSEKDYEKFMQAVKAGKVPIEIEKEE